MRGNAVAGHRIHFFGADLDFNRHAVHAEQRGVQALVAVHFRDGDKVLELARHRLVQIVHGTKHAITGIHLISNDTEGKYIGDVFERALLQLHLLVDAVQMLLAANDPAGQAFALETGHQRRFDLRHQLFAMAADAFHCGFDQRCPHRIQHAKAQLLELHADVVHAKTIGDGGVDIDGFLGDAAALLGTQHFQRAHVVQTVGQFDEDDANVFRHRQRHLLEVLGLHFGLGAEIQFVEFADAIDQVGHRLAELAGDGLTREAGVFNGVVQHGGHQALMVHVHFLQDAGYGQRVRYVGFAAAAGLAVVGLRRVVVGAPDQVDLGRLEVGREFAGERVYGVHVNSC